MKPYRVPEALIDNFAQFASHYADISPTELKPMIRHLPIAFFKKGTVLIRQGEPVTRCFFILQGCARKYAVNEEGKEITSDFITEHQSIAILTSKDSPYFVTCLEDSLMIVGDLDQQSDEFDTYPVFADITRKMMEESLGKMHDEYAAFISMGPEDRVRRLMQTRMDLFTRVPQHQLASYIGITAESLSRIKRRLAESSLV